jgi:hypothetical protein
VREDPKQARRDLDDALRSHDSTRVAKAVSRCRAWIWLRETLENLLDDRNWIEGNKPYRVWIHPADAERYARESGDSREKARDFLEWIEELSLRESLADAERRIVLLDQTLSDAIARTSRRIFEGVKNEIESDFGGQHSEPTVWVVSDLGDAIKAVGMLLDADLALARKSQAYRSPADREKCVLRELLLADGGRSAEELAEQLRGRVQPDGKKRSIDAKGVSDAIGRLREECGYRIPNDGKTGYRVDDTDRELAREHGVSDGTDGTLSE